MGSHLKSSKLKVMLVTGDAVAFALGYALILDFANFPTTHGWFKSVAVVAAAIVIGLFADGGVEWLLQEAVSPSAVPYQGVRVAHTGA